MFKTFLAAAVATAVTIPTVVAPADARPRERYDSRYYYSDGRYRTPRNLSRNDHVWRGKDGRQYVGVTASGGSFLNSPSGGDSFIVFALPKAK